MSQIHFHEDFYLPILEGSKTQTARIDEPIPETGNGEAIFSDGRSIPIQILEVSHKCFNHLSLEEVQKDGFNTHKELWNVLIGFYPKLSPTDELMLIQFRSIS